MQDGDLKRDDVMNQFGENYQSIPTFAVLPLYLQTLRDILIQIM